MDALLFQAAVPKLKGWERMGPGVALPNGGAIVGNAHGNGAQERVTPFSRKCEEFEIFRIIST